MKNLATKVYKIIYALGVYFKYIWGISCSFIVQTFQKDSQNIILPIDFYV